MIISVIDNYSISKKEIEYVNYVVEKCPEIKELQKEIINSSQNIINQLQQIYKDNNLDNEEFNKEKISILKITNLFFCFKVLFYAVSKAGAQLKRMLDINNKVLSEKDNIIKEFSDRNKLISEQLKDFKNKLEEQKTSENIKMLSKIQIEQSKIIELKNKIVMTPLSFGEHKINSTINFIESLDYCISDYDITESGIIKIADNQYQVDGSFINKNKELKGLNGRNAPRGIKDTDKIIIKHKK